MDLQEVHTLTRNIILVLVIRKFSTKQKEKVQGPNPSGSVVGMGIYSQGSQELEVSLDLRTDLTYIHTV